ncbi:hypothetical protein PBI_SCTP2_489 [Salicola phage SCTP-2]|nr:hypothetical protein PBI_SCTP2_489 [Salicola phage SCTP-2]
MIQFLTFTISDQQFAINIQNICEIKEFEDLTIAEAPGSPWFVEGITYFRQTPIGLCNLSKFFAQNQIQNGMVIITENTHETLLGLIVEKVNDIISIDEDEIEQYSKVFFKPNYTNIITSVVKHNEGLYNVVNIDELHDL